ncbi:MAG: 50S ribosomal protein L10 [Candidatus Omnitrophica bacterium]|nr:50S ribosomal protein L10 [Candidatus Omnitrophota bacterium]
MEKVSRLIKSLLEEDIRKNLRDKDCVFLLNYSKISASQLANFRSILKAHTAGFRVIKNNIAKRVFETEGLKDLVNILEGPCGIVWADADPVVLSKTILNFAKENEGLKVKGGLLKNRIILADDFLKLATLPSKDVLYAKLAQVLKSPINLLVFNLSEVLRRLVYVLNSIKYKKEEKG